MGFLGDLGSFIQEGVSAIAGGPTGIANAVADYLPNDLGNTVRSFGKVASGDLSPIADTVSELMDRPASTSFQNAVADFAQFPAELDNKVKAIVPTPKNLAGVKSPKTLAQDVERTLQNEVRRVSDKYSLPVDVSGKIPKLIPQNSLAQLMLPVKVAKPSKGVSSR
jgi:hypothetical protein